MIAADILLDGLFAAIAAIGFGAVSDPPMRAFPRIALLAAMGHALRFCLMHYFSVDIATASLFASISIGFGSLWLGRGIRCPMTALYIPALLPMVPGIYAYKTVFSLIMFLQSLNDPGEGLQYMQAPITVKITGGNKFTPEIRIPAFGIPDKGLCFHR